jgi:hypothetical protein
MSKNFTKEPIFEPSSNHVNEFACRILNLIEANKCLEDAKARVPSYTAQHNREDYYKDEQEHWNYCAQFLYESAYLIKNPLTKFSNSTQKPEYEIDPNLKGHQWNRDGERCLKCGAKDWMGGPCNDESSDNPCNLGIPVQNGTS